MVVAAFLLTTTGGAFAKPFGDVGLNAGSWRVVLLNGNLKPMQTTAGISFDFANVADNFDRMLLTTETKVSGTPATGSLTAEFAITGTGVFSYNTAGGLNPPGGTPPTVRLFFQTNGFSFEHFWWSNPAGYQLAVGAGTQTLTVVFDPGLWSDWNGQFGNTDANHIAEFNAAVSDIRVVGLSFGGGFFFAVGVGLSSGSATFELTKVAVS